MTLSSCLSHCSFCTDPSFALRVSRLGLFIAHSLAELTLYQGAATFLPSEDQNDASFNFSVLTSSSQDHTEVNLDVVEEDLEAQNHYDLDDLVELSDPMEYSPLIFTPVRILARASLVRDLMRCSGFGLYMMA